MADPKSREDDKEDNEEKRKLHLEALRMEAERGEPSSQYALGCAYQYGEMVAEDQTEAVKWFRLAAEQGHAEAQQVLSRL